VDIEDIMACLKRGEDITASQAVVYAQHQVKQENEACARLVRTIFDLPVVARAIRERIDQITNRS
jgi:hypothetical protein